VGILGSKVIDFYAISWRGGGPQKPA